MMVNEEIIEEIQGWIDEIEADERYNYPPANIEVNAPLALMQVSWKGQVNAYKRVIAMLEKEG